MGGWGEYFNCLWGNCVKTIERGKGQVMNYIIYFKDLNFFEAKVIHQGLTRSGKCIVGDEILLSGMKKCIDGRLHRSYPNISVIVCKN